MLIHLLIYYISYLDNVERFAATNYVPSNDDVLKVRQKTSGPLIHSSDGYLLLMN